MKVNNVVVLMLLVLGLPVVVGAQTSQEVNEANNPLTPKITINLQDMYATSYYGLPHSDSNTGLLRGVLPHRLFGWPQILRATVPLVTSPDCACRRRARVADLLRPQPTVSTRALRVR